MSSEAALPPASPPSSPPRRHGNLRVALVDAGLALLASDGLEGLTLRRCAALAGVSHAAPAHHFNGLPGLLDAIAAHGFEQFARAMIEEAGAKPADPRIRLEAICVGYFAFAEANPTLFNLMFRRTCSPDGAAPELQLAAARAHGVLMEACEPFVGGDAASGIVQMQVWSLIHGYSSLAALGQMGRGAPGASLSKALAILQTLVLKS